MTTFADESCGPGYIGIFYGIMLTEWSAAEIVEPSIVAKITGIAVNVVSIALLMVGLLLASR